MKKFILFFSIFSFFISCKNNSEKSDSEVPEKTLTEKIADKAGKIIPENVYEIKGNGEKGKQIFVIEGTKLFLVDKKSKKIILEKRGNKVYDLSKEKNDPTPISIFENEKYWDIKKDTGEKGDLIFERKGDTIYENKGNRLEKILVVE